MPSPFWLRNQVLGQKSKTGEATALIKLCSNLPSTHHAPGHGPSIVFYLHNNHVKQVRLPPSYRCGNRNSARCRDAPGALCWARGRARLSQGSLTQALLSLLSYIPFCTGSFPPSLSPPSSPPPFHRYLVSCYFASGPLSPKFTF